VAAAKKAKSMEQSTKKGQWCQTVYDIAAHIRYQLNKTPVLSCHGYLINTGVEKMNNIQL
jgi:hypothetical protein